MPAPVCGLHTEARREVTTMTFKRLVAVFGLCVSMVGCGMEQEQVEGGEALVPVTDAPEFHQDGASIAVVDGLSPLLVPGTVRAGMPEASVEGVSAMSESLNQ
jgi:hypothetical protein